MINNLIKILKIWSNIARHPLNGSIISAGLRRIGWQVKSRIHREVVLPWANGLTLTGQHGMISISMQAYNGIHELRDMCFAAHLLREGDVFFDVGANIGVYSLLIARISDTNVCAFEPIPESADFLETNIHRNQLNGRILPIRQAVSFEAGEVVMYSDDDVMNKIVQSAQLNAISTRLKQGKPVMVRGRKF